MDTGHYNCRDYYVSESTTYSSLQKAIGPTSHESPINQKPQKSEPFPLLQLPLELRQKIYLYLLPSTTRRDNIGIRLAIAHVGRTGCQKSRNSHDDVIWRRGQTSLLRVSRQIHDECASLLYGNSPFLLFVRYDTISFRYSFLLPSGLAPSKPLEFLDTIPACYIKLIRQLIVTIDHPDSYTGMIKYNVGGKGLTHGLRSQVQKLVDALRPLDDHNTGLNSIRVTLINGNKFMDSEKWNIVRARDHEYRGDDEIQVVLEPFAELHHIARVEIKGALTETFAEVLQATMNGA